MSALLLLFLLVAAFLFDQPGISAVQPHLATNDYKHIQNKNQHQNQHIQLPHDEKCFTQGLEIYEGKLFESCGLYGRSSLRVVNTATGRPDKIHRLARQYFAEGFTIHEGVLYLLTWKSRTMFIFDVSAGELQLLGTKRYNSHTGQGWGLTTDGKHLFMSDGSEVITVFQFPDLNFDESSSLPTTTISNAKTSAATVAALKRSSSSSSSSDGVLKKVRDFRVLYPQTGSAVKGLNELEYKDGFIYANVWYKDFILRIDASTAVVADKFDLSHIYPRRKRSKTADCLNGIAYNRTSDSFLLTGKLWPKYHAVNLTSSSSSSSGDI